MRTLFVIGFVPLIGLALLPWVIETRGQKMPVLTLSRLPAPPTT